ncbi:MAG: phage holin family protein [Parcubacteria group bacterium]
MRLIIKWIVMAASILAAAYFIPGVTVDGLKTALILAVVLGLINLIIKPILILITLPVNILTLGLFTFVINALLIMLASSIVKGFEVDGFLTALIFGIILSAINFILSKLLDTLD